MAILKEVQPHGNHRCTPPDHPEESYGRGTVWECDDCGKQARLENDQREGWIWVWMLPPEYLPSSRSPKRSSRVI